MATLFFVNADSDGWHAGAVQAPKRGLNPGHAYFDN
jgi:hypothetical protein